MTTRSQVPRRRRWMRGVMAMAAVLALGATTAIAQDWNGVEDIGLGDTATSVFGDRALGGFGEGHAYRFYAPAGTKIQATLQPAKGVDLEVALQVTKDGVALPILERIKVKKLKVTLKKFLLEESGYYEYRVVPVRGTGEYSLKTKGTLPKKDKETVQEMTYEFDVVGPTQLKNATVKGAKGTSPVFTALTGPAGDISIGEPSKKLKKIDLPDTGTYTLTYVDENAAGKKLVEGEWSVQLKLKPPKSKEMVENPLGQTRIPMVTVDTGDPHAGAAAPGYAGSNACRDCHGEYADSVGNSFHNSKVRSTFREGAAGYVVPPVPDALFKAPGGTDLKEALDTYDALPYALRLSHVPGDDLPYKITIGNNLYDVLYVLGGNGPWKQRYIVKIGQSHYMSPVQYNDDADSWSIYNGEHWDVDGPTSPNNSWERRCGACHATGILLAYDEGTGEYLTGYAELNIGCEACHGAGQAHVDSQSADDILNPRDLMDGTPEGVQAADLTCGQCHHRGSGGKPDNAPSSTGYPWKNGTGIFPPGGSEAEFDTFYTTGSGIFFRYKDNPTGFAPTPDDTSDDTHNASKKHHQQYLDLHNGPHAPNKGYDGACFDCHDAHADNTNRKMLAETITRGDETFTDISNDNNKLCLACHKGHGDFASVTPSDVHAITDESAPPNVVNATVDHMADKAAMPVMTSQYDPAGEGALGRCSTCHMPDMSKSAVYGTDAAGNQVGDVSTHMFWPVWPNISELESITNSCNLCHPTDPNDFVGDVIAAWATDEDADGTFHADTPRNFQNGVANGESAGGGMACSACHTTQGFIDAIVGDGMQDLIDSQEDRDGLILDSITFDKGITCEACHGKQADGTFAAGDNPLRIPAADLCGSCHMNETIQFDDYVAHGEIVRHPMQQMMDGVEGGEVMGANYANSFHSSLSCVDCHFEQGESDNHSFAPRLDSCNASGCHSGLSDFNRTARGDYDGDMTTEGIQDEVTGVKDLLHTEILAYTTSTGAVITYSAPYYLIDGDRSNTAALHATNDAAVMRAIFNQYWTDFEGSLGVHNTSYALQLLQNSYEELTGMGWAADTGGVKR